MGRREKAENRNRIELGAALCVTHSGLQLVSIRTQGTSAVSTLFIRTNTDDDFTRMMPPRGP